MMICKGSMGAELRCQWRCVKFIWIRGLLNREVLLSEVTLVTCHLHTDK